MAHHHRGGSYTSRVVLVALAVACALARSSAREAEFARHVAIVRGVEEKLAPLGLGRSAASASAAADDGGGAAAAAAAARPSPDEFYRFKHDLAQLNGNLEKFQFTKIDAVETGEVVSRRS